MSEDKTRQQIDAMNDLILSITIKANEGFNDKTHKVQYKLTPAQAEELDVITRALALDGREITYKAPYLHIDSTNVEIPPQE